MYDRSPAASWLLRTWDTQRFRVTHALAKVAGVPTDDVLSCRPPHRRRGLAARGVLRILNEYHRTIVDMVDTREEFGPFATAAARQRQVTRKLQALNDAIDYYTAHPEEQAGWIRRMAARLDSGGEWWT